MGWVSSAKVSRKAPMLQIIGQSIRQPNTGLGLTTAVQVTGKVSLGPFPVPIKTLQLPLEGKYITSAFAVANIPKIYTCKFAIGIVDGSSTTSPAITWGGSATKTLNPGDAMTLSDDWCIANGVIPANTCFELRYDMTVPTAGILSAPDLSEAKGLSGPYAATCQWFTSLGVSQTLVTDVGAISTSGAGGNQLAPPQLITAILGKFDALKTSAFIIGNSKFTGTGAGVTTDQFSGKSAISRALYDLKIPSASVALAGTTVQQWSTINSSAYAHAAWATDVILGDPINDIVTSLASLATIQGYYTTLVGKIRAINPTANIWITQPEPAVDTQVFSITSLTSSGTTATANVADTTGFSIGDSIVVSGATPTAYNGTYKITALVANTSVSYTFAGGTSPATGTPVFTDGYTTLARQTGQVGAVYPGSVRDQFIAWLPTQVSSGLLIKGVLDGSVNLENGGSGASGKWKSGKTLDGLHMTDRGYTDAASAYKQQFIAQGIIPNTGAF